MSLANWHVCWYCKSNDFIINEFDSSHPAYRIFKAKTQREWDIHEKSQLHLDFFKKYYCEDCELQYWNTDSFNKHKETYRHKKNTKVIMSCNVCNYNTTNKQRMDEHNSSNRHIIAINGIKTKFECKDCERMFRFKSDYDSHILTKKHQNKVNNIDKKSYECKECRYSAKTQSLYNQHLLTKKHYDMIHSEKETLECKHCNYIGKTKALYNKHISGNKHLGIVSNQYKQEYECKECNFKTKYKSHYDAHINTKRHQKVVSKELKEEYECKECNFKAKYKSHYDIHVSSKKHQSAVNKNGLVNSQTTQV